MMALLLSKVGDSIHKRQRFSEIREAVILLEVMLVDNFPTRELIQERRDLFAL